MTALEQVQQETLKAIARNAEQAKTQRRERMSQRDKIIEQQAIHCRQLLSGFIHSIEKSPGCTSRAAGLVQFEYALADLRRLVNGETVNSITLIEGAA